jgi:hypothetical protein
MLRDWMRVSILEVQMFFRLSGGAPVRSEATSYQSELNASIESARSCFRSSERRWSHRDRTATTPDGFVWREDSGRSGMRRIAITGWALSLVGFSVWLYGYFLSGHAALLDWAAYTPWWVADFLPNVEAEVGMALMCLGTGASYWPKSGGVQA